MADENIPPVYQNPSLNDNLPTIQGTTHEDLGKSLYRSTVVDEQLRKNHQTCTLEEAGKELAYQHQLVQRAAAPDVVPAWFVPAMQQILSPIRRDVNAIRQDVSAIQQDVRELRQDTNVLKNNDIRLRNSDNGTPVKFPVVTLRGGTVERGQAPTRDHLSLSQDFCGTKNDILGLTGPQLSIFANVYNDPALKHGRGNTLSSRRQHLLEMIYEY